MGDVMHVERMVRWMRDVMGEVMRVRSMGDVMQVVKPEGTRRAQALSGGRMWMEGRVI